MPTINGRLPRQSSSTAALPRLVLLPALYPDADPRPALVPPPPRSVPVLFNTVSEALTELRRLQQAGAASGRA